MVPESEKCVECDAPHIYLYYNDGKKRTQLRCKVCWALFTISKRHRHRNKTKYWCPYCEHALYKWKEERLCIIYKYAEAAAFHCHMFNLKNKGKPDLKFKTIRRIPIINITGSINPI